MMSLEKHSASKNSRQESEEYMMSSSDSTLIEFTSNYQSISSKFNSIDDNLRDKISKLLQNDTQDKLTQLYTDTINVYSFASQYDYSPSMPFNGFRLVCKMIFIYFNKLSLDVKSLSSQIGLKTKKDLIVSINLLVDYLPLLVHQMQGIKLARQLKLCQEEAKDNADTDATLALELQMVTHLMKLRESDMLPFYQKKVESFWLPKSIAKFMRLQNKILLCFTEYPLLIGIQGLFNDNKYSKLAATQSVKWTPIHLKSEDNFIKRFAKSPNKSLLQVIKYNLSERQSKWIIDKELSTVIEKSVAGEDEGRASLPPVRLDILRPRNRSTDTVIVQIHGGGWALGSPKMYYGIMGEWVEAIGCTIVAIDYSLAPDHKYPVALQEILDTYIWLSDASASESILEPLGHVPRDFVITGDSAGGNLSVALAVLLAEISKISNNPPKFPKALDLMYPAISPGLPISHASSVYLDTILSPCKRLQFGVQYYMDDPGEGEESYLCRPESPWFTNEDKLKTVYTKVNGKRSRDPLFHLHTYKSFDLLKDVKLFVQGAEFDPLCDDAILISKIWAGSVQLDIMPDVIHAWPFLADRSIECRKAFDLTNERLKQAVLASDAETSDDGSQNSQQ